MIAPATDDQPGALAIELEPVGRPGLSESRGGVIKAPKGAGLGVTIDPEYVKTHAMFSG